MTWHHEIGKVVARAFMAITGWRVAGGLPEGSDRHVIIAAPHTTNWDFIYLLAAAMVLKIPIYWLGKKELFAPPFGWFMRLLGGIAVDRSERTNLVQQVADHMKREGTASVVIPPSGTRGRADHWRSGFYWVAVEADATIVCGYLDWPKKEAGLGYAFKPSGNAAADMPAVRTFYESIRGKFPEQETPMRLREEETASDDPQTRAP